MLLLLTKLVLLGAGTGLWLFVSYLMWWRWGVNTKRWQTVTILLLNLTAIGLLLWSASYGNRGCA